MSLSSSAAGIVKKYGLYVVLVAIAFFIGLQSGLVISNNMLFGGALILVVCGFAWWLLSKQFNPDDVFDRAFALAQAKWKKFSEGEDFKRSGWYATEGHFDDNPELTFFEFVFYRREGRAANKPAIITVKADRGRFGISYATDNPDQAELDTPFFKFAGALRTSPVPVRTDLLMKFNEIVPAGRRGRGAMGPAAPLGGSSEPPQQEDGK